MSNETDLDWLARNVHEWPAGEHQPWCYVYMAHGGVIKASGNFLDAVAKPTMITMFQWLARRAELQNKPRWEDAIQVAEFLAQDATGGWTWFGGMPEKYPDRFDIGHDGYEEYSGMTGEVLGDWRDTLEKRPEEFQPFTSIEDNQEKDMKQDNGWFERGELPPVGVECIAVTDGIPDANCVIIAISTEQVVVKWTENQMFDVLDMPGWSFRPIRTERDQLVDVLSKAGIGSYALIAADAILAAGFSLRDK